MQLTRLTLSVICLFFFQTLSAQQENLYGRKADIVNLGPGLGFDYGGIGLNITAYPQKNIGIFVGGGYAFAGFGYNAGVKLRTSMPSVVNPFFMMMYGYNAAVSVGGYSQYDKLFYGPTMGFGIDIRSKKPSSKGYLSMSVNIPFRDPEAQRYIDQLKNENGFNFENELVPVGFSIGYKFILNN